VFKIGTSLSPKAIHDAWAAVYEANSILSTRIVCLGNAPLLQAIVKDEISWLEGDNLQVYLEEDAKGRMDYGTPLARYAIVEGIYFVWSVHCSLLDARSQSLILHNLYECLSSKDASLGDGPKFNVYLHHIQATERLENPSSHWQTCLQDADNDTCMNFIQSTPLNHDTMTSEVAHHMLHDYTFPSHLLNPISLIKLAWAYLLHTLSGGEDVLFGSLEINRPDSLRGSDFIRGPVSAIVPVYLKMHEEISLLELYQMIDSQSKSPETIRQSGMRTLLGKDVQLLSVVEAQDEKSQVINNLVEGLELCPKLSVAARHACVFHVKFYPEGASSISISYDNILVTKEQIESIITKLAQIVRNATDAYEYESLIPLNLLSDDCNKKETNSAKRDTKLQNHSIATADDKLARNIATDISKIPSLGHPDMDEYTTLTQAGVDIENLHLIEEMLVRNYDITPDIKRVSLRNTSARQLASYVHQLQSYSSKTSKANEEIEARIELLKGQLQISESSSIPTHQNNTVALLTGAAGYTGIHILRKLVDNPQMTRVFIIIRCKTVSDGIIRIEESAKKAHWPDKSIRALTKLVIMPGDLSIHQFGLDDNEWLKLRNEVDLIIHNGCAVHFLRNYQSLEATNVLSTLQLLQMQLNSERQPHFIYVTGGRSPGSRTDQTMSRILQSCTGYGQTKYASEILLQKAQELRSSQHGHNMQNNPGRFVIVHPGMIIGDSQDGVANIDDYLWRFVAACVYSGHFVYPVPHRKSWLLLSPVDTVASNAVRTNRENTFSRDNITCGMSYDDFWRTINSSLDAPLKSIKYDSWLELVKRDLSDRKEDHPLWTLSERVLSGKLGIVGSTPPKVHQHEQNIEDSVRRNVKYLMDKGFIRQPMSTRQQKKSGDFVDVFKRTGY